MADFVVFFFFTFQRYSFRGWSVLPQLATSGQGTRHSIELRRTRTRIPQALPPIPAHMWR